MEAAKPAPATSLSSLTRTVTKILQFRRAVTASRGFSGDDSNQKVKQKPNECLSGVSGSHISWDGKAEDNHQQEESGSSCSNRVEPDIESLLANIFAGVSAIKAAYAQLQVAESPYDPDTIQESDQAVVSELQLLSLMKQSYMKQQQLLIRSPADSQMLPPQLQEQRSLLKTYQITAGKLESGLRHMEAEFLSLQAQLLESERYNRSLESRLHCDQTLPLSVTRPKHFIDFIAAVRSAVKSVRSFVIQMAREMVSSGWDLDAAAGVIQPDVRGKPEHWIYAFESFVCRSMFAHFQNRDFGVSSLDGRPSLVSRRFSQEFVELNSTKPTQGAISGVEKFIQSKYLSLVHPKMESSFFGNLHGRAAISSGQRLPDSEFFALFAEMAKKVWLLHCLYFSYGSEVDAAIFQVKRGCRFSEVYMNSVLSASSAHLAASSSTVKFSVVPGFKVGKTLIQCNVYISKEG